MGIAAGLAWIIIGVLYMIYKYQTEEGGKSPGAAIGKIIGGVAAFFVVAPTLMFLSENMSSELESFLLYFVGIPLCVVMVCVLVWLIAGDVKKATKNNQINCEITNDSDVNAGLTRSQIEFRNKWFSDHDEYLSVSDTMSSCIAPQSNNALVQSASHDEFVTMMSAMRGEGTSSPPPDPNNVFTRESYQRFMNFHRHPDIQDLIQKFQDSGDWPQGQYAFNYEVYKSFVRWAGQDLVKILLSTYQDEGGIEKEEG